MTEPLVRVIDDDSEARSSTSFFLGMVGFETREYENALVFLEEDDLSRPGCLVIDVRMPKMNGLELQAELSHRGCDIPIVFLTGHGEVDMAVRALKRGADDFLEKSSKPERLQEAVEAAVRTSLDRACGEESLQALRDAYGALTEREKEVAVGVARGRLNKVIGADLGISERTVKMHRANACQKVGVRSAVEMADFLRKIGVLDA